MSNRKKTSLPPVVPSAAETVDHMAREFAAHMYDKRVREHEAELQREEERQAARLTDPQYAASFGLPEDLPEFTRQILGRTMSLDRLGPTRPKRDAIYRHYGATS